MALGIGKAVGRFRQAMRLPVAFVSGDTRSVLVLHLHEGERLRRRLGAALFERLLDTLALRLTIELGLIPQSRMPGQPEIAGVLSPRANSALPQRVALLGRICAEPVDLGELRLSPEVEGVIVRSMSSADLAQMVGFGRQALAQDRTQGAARRIQVLDYVAGKGDSAVASPPSPEARSAQIVPLFQPQICCDTGGLVALQVEGWGDDPGTGQTASDGHVERLNAVLRRALAALRGWDRRGHEVPFLSFPLSENALSDPLLVEMILWELDRLDLGTDRLEIEFTEVAGIERDRSAIGTNLARLASAGCRVAVGDFGTGSVGLDALQGFGVRRVRIGRSFVAGCHRRGDQQRMILAILALAENLGLKVVADQVITIDERAFLSQIGFSAVQGSAVGPAMDAERTEAFLIDLEMSMPSLPAIGQLGQGGMATHPRR